MKDPVRDLGVYLECSHLGAIKAYVNKQPLAKDKPVRLHWMQGWLCFKTSARELPELLY